MSPASWALKRVYKYLLKSVLGRLLKDEFDLEQLEVQLGTGTVNLRNLQLNEDYLNEQLCLEGLTISSGYVGSIRLSIPWKGLSTEGCEIVLDDIEINLSPTSTPACSTSESSTTEGLQFGEVNGAQPGDLYWAGEGICKIARMLEGFLLGLRARVTNTSLRFEDSLHPIVLVVDIPVLEYRDETPSTRDEHGLAGLASETTISPEDGPCKEFEVVRALSFNGITLQVSPEPSDRAQVILCGENGGGLEGSVRMVMRWREGCTEVPKVEMDCKVGGALLQLSPEDLDCVAGFLGRLWNPKESKSSEGQGVVGLAHQERALHELASSKSQSGRSRKQYPCFPPSNHCAPQTVEELLLPRQKHSSPGGKVAGVNQISDWVQESASLADQPEADVEASVEELFECVAGLASGHTSASSTPVLSRTRSRGLRNGYPPLFPPTVQPPRVHTGGQYSTRLEVSSFRVLWLSEGDRSDSQRTRLLDQELSWQEHSYLELTCQRVNLLRTASLDSSDLEASFGTLELSELSPLKSALPGERPSEALESLLAKAESALPRVAPPQRRTPRGSPGQFSNGSPGQLNNGSPGLFNSGSPSWSPLNQAAVHMQRQWQQVHACPWAAPAGLQKKRVLRSIGAAGQGVPMTPPALHLAASWRCQGASPSAGAVDVTVKVQPLAAVLELATYERLSASISRLAAALPSLAEKEPSEQAAEVAPVDKVCCHRHTAPPAVPPGSSNHPNDLNTHVFASHLRVLICLPQMSDDDPGVVDVLAVEVLGDQVLESGQPLVKLHNGHRKGQKLALRASATTAFLISNFPPSSSLSPRAHALCTFSSKSDHPLLELIWHPHASTGRWLAETAWSGVLSQQERGGNNGCSSRKDSSAARVAAREEEQVARELREKAVASSNVVVHVTLRKSKMDVHEWQLGRLRALVSLGGCFGGEREQEGEGAKQVTLLLECASSEMTLHTGGPESRPPEEHWESFQLVLGKTLACQVAAIGNCSDASYYWTRLDSCFLEGLFKQTHKTALSSQLFSCSNETLGRGDAAGSNALASPGTAGISLSAMLWPGGNKGASSAVTSSIRGGTFLSPGGRLDWVTALGGVVLAKPSIETNDSNARQDDDWSGSEDTEDSKGLHLRSAFFALDLHDLALVYLPQMKATTTKRHSPSGGSPVAAVLAAVSLKISNTLPSETTGAPLYNLCLRESSLLLLDTAVRPPELSNYSSESLRKTGYVVVAREALFECSICPPSFSSPWELCCVNNELRLYTRKDSTLALGRLAAQIQELLQGSFVQTTLKSQGVLDSPPKLEKGVKSGQKQTKRKGALSESLHPSLNPPGVLDGVQEDAFSPPQAPQQEGDSDSAESAHATGLVIEDFYQKCDCESNKPDSSNVVSEGGWYSNQRPEIVDLYIGRPEEVKLVNSVPNAGRGKGGICQLPKQYPRSLARVLLKDVRVRWQLQPGCHWGETSSGGGDQASTSLEVYLEGMQLQYDAFPQGGHYASRFQLLVRDIEVYDVSKAAPWRLVLGYHHSKPRESGSHALHFNVDSVRPDPRSLLEEYRLLVSLLPQRVHLDQRHVDFLEAFFSDLTSDTEEGGANAEGGFLPFFQMAEVHGFLIGLDYIPRRVNLSALKAGNLTELVNLVAWEGVDLTFKPVHANGVHGWANLGELLAQEWLQDISENQVGELVRGVAPLRPLLEVARGARALVTMPTAAYRKDRRWLRGLRQGAKTFLRALSLEALTLGAGVAGCAAELLQAAEAALADQPRTPPTSSPPDPLQQPNGTKEGIKQACSSLARGLERGASTLVTGPLKVYRRGAGAGEVVGSALRAAPAAAVAPVAAAAGAVQWALLGVRNEMDPSKKRDEKHLGSPPEGRRRH